MSKRYYQEENDVHLDSEDTADMLHILLDKLLYSVLAERFKLDLIYLARSLSRILDTLVQDVQVHLGL